jgi:hypothetical protein
MAKPCSISSRTASIDVMNIKVGHETGRSSWIVTSRTDPMDVMIIEPGTAPSV